MAREEREMDETFVYYESPVGRLALAGDGEYVTRVGFCPAPWTEKMPQGETPLLARARRQLEEYFAGRRKNFDLPLRPAGTPFRLRVWRALLNIGYGETCSYGELAKAVGNGKASRAVGGANHANPIVIIIPCHRVIGANGTLTGYGGGLDKKTFLLELEKKHIRP